MLPDRLTSEAPVLQFSGVPKPIQSLLDISSDTDEVFSETSLENSNMPPKVEDLYKKLDNLYKPWKQEVSQIKISKKVSNVQMEEFTDEYKEMRKLYKSLCRSDDMTEIANANKILNEINEDFLFLEELSSNKGSVSNNSSNNVDSSPPADSDVAVVQAIKIIASKFDTLNRRIQPMQAEISSTFVDSEIPEQSVALTRKITKIKADTEKIVEESYELDSKISMEIVKLSSDEKQKIELSSLETKMKSLKISVDVIQQSCDKYLDATSVKPVNSADLVRTVNTSSANDKLERLPFPRFSGKRVDWLFFKQMFLTQDRKSVV